VEGVKGFVPVYPQAAKEAEAGCSHEVDEKYLSRRLRQGVYVAKSSSYTPHHQGKYASKQLLFLLSAKLTYWLSMYFFSRFRNWSSAALSRKPNLNFPRSINQSPFLVLDGRITR